MLRKHLMVWIGLCLLLCSHGASADNLATAYFEGSPDAAKVAITIDDCFDMQSVVDMLDLFDEEGVKVTFYPIGDNIKLADGDVWRRMVDAGHEIGNHTQGHVQLNKNGIEAKTVIRQLHMMEQSLRDALGYEYDVKTVRPPYGRYTTNNTMGRIKDAGYDTIVLWSVSQTNAEEALKVIKNGSICLFHARPKDLRCLQELIPALKENGYELVTISELLGLDGAGAETAEAAESAPEEIPEGKENAVETEEMEKPQDVKKTEAQVTEAPEMHEDAEATEGTEGMGGGLFDRSILSPWLQ